MTTSGTVALIKGPPRVVKIQPPGDPPPPQVTFTPIPDDAWDVLNGAGDKPVTVEGVPPNCVSASKP